MTSNGHGARTSRARIALAMLGAVLALSAGCAATEDGALDDGATRRDAASPSGDGDGNGDRAEEDGAAAGDGAVVDEAPVADLDAASDAGDDADTDVVVDASDAARSDAALHALEDLPYARGVVSFTAGESAGFGQASFPEIVLGPPQGKGSNAGSLDVLSLGVGGEIVVDFGELSIVDGEGPDFIVFENAFVSSGSAPMTFSELGAVAVSDDGTTWHAFPCDVAGNAEHEHEGCAGWSPTLRYDPQLVVPLDPALTGGNAFDLATLELSRARYVRIQDLGTQPGTANTGGFDLDAVGLIHYEP